MNYAVPARDCEPAKDCALENATDHGPEGNAEPHWTAAATATRVPAGEVGPSDYSSDDLCDTLLAALVVLASKSKRRQADLTAALRRMNMPVTPEQVMSALGKLRDEGCVQHWVPLYDGGMLVAVTNRGMDQTGRNTSWRFLEQIHAVSA